MKKPTLFPLFIITFFSSIINTHAQTPIDYPWERVKSIEGYIQSFTKKQDSLFAYTSTNVFLSLDNGDTWKLRQSLGDESSGVIASKDSIAIIRRVINELNTGYITDLNYNVECYIGDRKVSSKTERLFASISFITNNHFVTKPQILNNGEIFYLYGSTHIIYSNQGSTVLVDEGTLYHGTPDNIEEQYLAAWTEWSESEHHLIQHSIFPYEDVIGKWGDYFVIYDKSHYQISLKKDTSVTITRVFPIAIQNVIGSSVTNDSLIYLASGNGQMLIGSDAGMTWEVVSIPDDAIEYSMKDGLHILKTADNVYHLSHNGSDFWDLPTNMTDSYYNKFWTFDDFVLFRNGNNYYRSLDKGVTWNAIFPKGIYADRIDNLFTYDDTIFVKAYNQLYRYECNGDFVKVDDRPELLNIRPYSPYNDFITSNNTILSDAHYYQDEDDRIFKFYHDGYEYNKDKLYFSTDDGNTWNRINHPEVTIRQIAAKGDTIITNCIFIKYDSYQDFSFDGYQTFYTTDMGEHWTILDPSQTDLFGKNTSTLPYLGNTKKIMQSSSRALIYNNLDEPPIDEISTGDAAQFSTRNWNTKKYLVFQWEHYYTGSNASLIDKSTDEIFTFNEIPTKVRVNDVSDHGNLLANRITNGFKHFAAAQDKSLFAGSRYNGLWRTSLNAIDTTTTKYYTSCKRYMEIDGTEYDSGKYYLQPKTTSCEPDSFIYINFISPLDTLIQLTKCPLEYASALGREFGQGTHHFIIQNDEGCDLDATVIVENEFDFVEVRDTIYGTPGDSVLFNGQWHPVPSSTDYNELSSQNGCDSVRFNLKVLSNVPPLTGIENHPVIQACEGDTVWVGNNVTTQTGIYTDTIFDSNGYDSLLSIYPVFFEEIDFNAVYEERFLCEGSTINIHDFLISAPGDYTFHYPQNEFGCDSTSHRIRVKGVSISYDTIQVNSGDVIDGVTIYQDTSFTHVILSEEFGCDSIVSNYQVDVLVGTDDLAPSNMRLYPNPASDQIILEHINSFDKILIVNTLGVTFETISIHNDKEKIDVNHLPSGFYMLYLIRDDAITGTLKFEKY